MPQMMNIKHLRFLVPVLLALVPAAFAQASPGEGEVTKNVPEYIRASPAFAEVIYRRAILETELEELLLRYTNDFPRVAEKRFELAELDLAIVELLDIPEEGSSKMTLALGKMLIQRAAYATEYDTLKRKYNDTHPEVKRAARKVQIFDKAIKSIL